MRNRIDRAIVSFFADIPDDGTLHSDRAIEALASSFEREARQSEKEMGAHGGRFDATMRFNNFIRKELAKDVRTLAAQGGGVSKADFLTLIDKVADEFRMQRLEDTAITRSMKDSGNEIAEMFKDGLEATRPVTAFVVNHETDTDDLAREIGAQEIKQRAEIKFALGHANETGTINDVYTRVTDYLLTQDLGHGALHSKRFTYGLDRALNQYLNERVASEESDGWQPKEIIDISMVLNEIAVYHSLMKQDGSHPKELQLIDDFLETLSGMPPEEKSPTAIERNFTKALRAGLTKDEYQYMTDEFTRHEQALIDRRRSKGHDVPESNVNNR